MIEHDQHSTELEVLPSCDREAMTMQNVTIQLVAGRFNSQTC